MTKDPYNLEFLGLGAGVAERKLESALVAHLQRFLLELGAGFAFVGRQYRFEVGGDEFFADLLFYHLHLRRFLCTRLDAAGDEDDPRPMPAFCRILDAGQALIWGADCHVAGRWQRVFLLVSTVRERVRSRRLWSRRGAVMAFAGRFP